MPLHQNETHSYTELKLAKYITIYNISVVDVWKWCFFKVKMLHSIPLSHLSAHIKGL